MIYLSVNHWVGEVSNQFRSDFQIRWNIRCAEASSFVDFCWSKILSASHFDATKSTQIDVFPSNQKWEQDTRWAIMKRYNFREYIYGNKIPQCDRVVMECRSANSRCKYRGLRHGFPATMSTMNTKRKTAKIPSISVIFLICYACSKFQ